MLLSFRKKLFKKEREKKKKIILNHISFIFECKKKDHLNFNKHSFVFFIYYYVIDAHSDSRSKGKWWWTSIRIIQNQCWYQWKEKSWHEGITDNDYTYNYKNMSYIQCLFSSRWTYSKNILSLRLINPKMKTIIFIFAFCLVGILVIFKLFLFSLIFAVNI